jgi:hypothetical protein
MAITRREHREYGRSNSCYLRSRVIILTTNVVRVLVRKSQQAHMKCMKGGTEKPAAIGIDMYEFWDHPVDGEPNADFF